MQLKAALEFAMEAPQLVVYHHKLWLWCTTCVTTGLPPVVTHVQQVYHLLHKSTTHNRRLWVVVVAFFLLTAKGVPPFACANLRFANENEVFCCGLLWITSSGPQQCSIIVVHKIVVHKLNNRFS